MEEFECGVGTKIYPDDRFSPLEVYVGILREKKLPGETDTHLIERTLKKANLALVFGINEAIKQKKDILITSLGPEEMEVIAKNAVNELQRMEQIEQEQRVDESNNQ